MGGLGVEEEVEVGEVVGVVGAEREEVGGEAVVVAVGEAGTKTVGLGLGVKRDGVEVEVVGFGEVSAQGGEVVVEDHFDGLRVAEDVDGGCRHFYCKVSNWWICVSTVDSAHFSPPSLPLPRMWGDGWFFALWDVSGGEGVCAEW